jgi:hypothetical protein
MTCNRCNAPIQPGWIACPNCGLSFSYQPAQVQPKKSGSTFWTAVRIVVIFSILSGGLSYFTMFRPNDATVMPTGNPLNDVGEPHTVTYKVTGTASSVSVTYETPQGGTSQATVKVPFEMTATFKSGDFVSLLAQNQDDSGTVISEIDVDNEPLKRTTSSGPYVIADASGSIP